MEKDKILLGVDFRGVHSDVGFPIFFRGAYSHGAV